MSDIVTERSGGILRVELNRPSRKNAMTAGMYTGLADTLRKAATDEAVRVVLWHGGMRSAPATTSGIFSRIRPGRANPRRPA